MIYLLCLSIVPLKCKTRHPKVHVFCSNADVRPLEQDSDIALGLLVNHTAVQT